MTKISGFTIARNAVKLCFPLEASIASLLDVCDEVVVNVGQSEDDTLEVVRGIASPKVRIVESTWDLAKRNYMLGEETLKAMRACTHPWGIYIQADEVLHEDGARILKEKTQEWDGDARVEGLLVDYLHFYGGFETIGTSRRWYRRETRCIRLGKDIRPYQGAQGFRVGPEYRRIGVRVTGAPMFHYGWARPAKAIREKHEASKVIYPWSRERSEQEQARGYLEWLPLLRPFTGAHPRVAREWVAERAHDPDRIIGPRHFKLEHIRLYVSDWIERLTGTRLWEFRNYEVV